MHKLYKAIENEVATPLKGTVKGTIPVWVNGSLYRNGPGLHEIGEHKLNHWFDGVGLLQRFHISKGKVTYQRRFIQSDTYVKNTTSGRISYNSFATAAMPDPCQNIFRRFLTVFESHEVPDNTFVHVFNFNDEMYAATDSLYLNRIDPETLDKLNKVSLEEKIGVKIATAHPHFDADGTMHNIGHMFKRRMYTVLFKVPPKKDGEHGFPTGEIVYKTPSPWIMHFNYYHSFCMSENYYIFIEQPLLHSMPKLVIGHQMGHSFTACTTFYPEIKNRFRIVDKKTGKEVNADIVVESDTFYYFHQINAYEDQGHIIVDISCFKNYDIIERLYMKTLTSEEYQKHFRTLSEPEARRYVIPMDLQGKESNYGDMVTLENVDAKCTKTGNKTYHCEPELLAEIGMEFPQINYEKFNTRKYRYIYGVGMQHSESTMFSLVKIDANTKTYTQWKEDSCYPSEPVFVRNPGGEDEDDGVLIAAVNRAGEGDNENSCFMLVLDAKSFTEMARVEFEGVERFPRDLHGTFTSNKK